MNDVNYTTNNNSIKSVLNKCSDVSENMKQQNKKKTSYFFREDYINESNAFVKYFEAVKENGFLESIIDDVDNMGDFCDLFREVCRDYPNDTINMFYDPLPAQEKSNSILYASELLRLQDSKDKGRKLVAAKRVPRDQILINEYPTILQVTPLCNCVGDTQTSMYRCHNCGIACKIFYTCDGCNVCIFCTRDCLYNAYKEYHRYECYGLQRHFWSMEDTDYSYLSFRMMIYGASRNFDTEPEPFKYGNFANNYPFIYKLETNFESLSRTKLNEILYSTTRNLIYLIRKTNFFEQFKQKFRVLEDLYLYIGGMMVKHYCQAQINNVLINYPNLAVGYGLNVTSGTGKAICPTIALLNHSCSPNATIVICTNFIVVKSVKPIKPGEEVTICYSEINALLSVPERQMVTEEIFDFTCYCSFCQFERDLADGPFKCLRCMNGNAKQIESKDSKPRGMCFKCRKEFSLEKHYQNLKMAAICRNLYKETFSIEHLTRIAECYSNVFPNNSLYLLDVYKILHEKHIHWGEQPLEAMKYGLLVFNIIEHCIPRLYTPLLVSKVNFMHMIVEMKKFGKIKKVSSDEYETIKIFVNEVAKVKTDLLFYLPTERLQFFIQPQKKVYNMFQTIKSCEENNK